ncbi:transposable element Tc1 transposase [Trichonephila clavipes]|nr:transposable element Tc1 transposase [Trichonephila clavipes]
MLILGSLVYVKRTVKVADYLSIIAVQLHPYITSVFPIGNGIFQQDSIPCQKAIIVIEGLEERKDEFQLISWPPNSADFNLIGPIWDFIDKHSSEIKHLQVGISRLSIVTSSYIDIWKNLSQAIYQELMVSMPRRIAAVTQVESGVMCYRVGVDYILSLRCNIYT